MGDEPLRRVIVELMGVPHVVPGGSAQVSSVWLYSSPLVVCLFMHGARYLWLRGDYGELRGVPQNQFLFGWSSQRIIHAAFDRHAASGCISKPGPLVMFIAATDQDAFRQAIAIHRRLPYRFVFWHTCEAAGAAAKAVDAVKAIKLGCCWRDRFEQ